MEELDEKSIAFDGNVPQLTVDFSSVQILLRCMMRAHPIGCILRLHESENEVIGHVYTLEVTTTEAFSREFVHLVGASYVSISNMDDHYMYNGAGGWAGSQAIEEEPHPYHIPPGYAPGLPQPPSPRSLSLRL